MTQVTAGSLVKSFGKLVKGSLSLEMSLEKSVHGACFRAYSPDTQVSEPTEGSPSAYPVNVLPAVISSLSRLWLENVCGQESFVMPWVQPANSAISLGWLWGVIPWEPVHSGPCDAKVSVYG